MSFSLDFSSIRTVRIHKQQFDAIDNKANVVMLTCIEDGRVIPFNRADNEKDKNWASWEELKVKQRNSHFKLNLLLYVVVWVMIDYYI